VAGRSIHGRLTVLRPATSDDIDLLVGWHEDPDVNRWWDRRPLTHEEVAAKYVGCRSPGVEAFIVESGGEPIGYLQWWLDDEPGHAGLDMFLVPNARHHGLGPDAALAAVEALRELGFTRITVDPLVDNERAIRAWRKAGFVEEREFDGEDGRALLMVHAGS